MPIPNPFDPWGWLTGLFQWFVNSWTQSGGEALQDAITQLTSAQFPKMNEEWFMNLWNSTFGLSLLIGLAAVIVHAIIFTFRAKNTTIVASIVSFLRLVLNGSFLLLVVVLAMGLVDFLVTMMMTWLSGMIDATTWSNIFTFASDVNGLNIWIKLGISNVTMYIGNTLYLNTLVMNYWIYIFVIWYLFGSALGVGKVAQFVRSMIFAALLTVLFARVFQVFHLGLTAVILNVAESIGIGPIVIFLGILFAGAVAVVIPLFMFIAFTVASYKVERRLDVRAFMEKQMKNTAKANPGQLAEERVSRAQAIGNSVKDAAGGAVRWAALAAATAGFAKLAAGIGAKAASAAPTPHTKVVAVGLMAAQAGANWLQGKTESFIHNRVGRPGANRARNRQLTA